MTVTHDRKSTSIENGAPMGGRFNIYSRIGDITNYLEISLNELKISLILFVISLNDLEISLIAIWVSAISNQLKNISNSTCDITNWFRDISNSVCEITIWICDITNATWISDITKWNRDIPISIFDITNWIKDLTNSLEFEMSVIHFMILQIEYVSYISKSDELKISLNELVISLIHLDITNSGINVKTAAHMRLCSLQSKPSVCQPLRLLVAVYINDRRCITYYWLVQGRGKRYDGTSTPTGPALPLQGKTLLGRFSQQKNIFF